MFRRFLFVFVWSQLPVKPAEAITTEDENYLYERFNFYSEQLQDTVVQNAYKAEQYSTCAYRDVCDASVLNTLLWENKSSHFPNGVNINESYVGHKFVAGAVESNEINEICFASNSRQQWLTNLMGDTYSALAWQYLGFAKEGIYSYFPLSNWSATSECPGDYDPRQRAWYRSAISGPLNVVILIDTTKSSKYDATQRLQRQKESAVLLIESLNYWSLFNVGSYSDDATFFAGQNNLLRATSDNKAAVISYINGLSLDESEYVSVATSLDSATRMMAQSERSGISSFCHTLFVFLSSDHDDLSSTITIDDAIAQYSPEGGKVVILSFVFNFENYIVDPIFEAMTCKTNGFQRVLTSSSYEASVESLVNSYSSYLAATLVTDSVHYSEVYEDVQNLGEMTTGTLPLYSNKTDGSGNTVRSVVGVYGIDLVLSPNMNNNGAISNADIMSTLAQSTSCPDLIASDETLAYFRDSSACTVELDQVNYGSDGKFPLEEDKWQYDLIGSFCLIGLIAVSCYCLFRIFTSNAKNDAVAAIAVVCFFFQIVFGITLVAYTLSTTWDDAMFYRYWKPSNMTVLSTSIDPQICCNVVDCGNGCASFFGDSCSSKIENYESGYCDNGYYCCATRTESCNCDNDGHCQTCTYCTQSTNYAKCRVECLECYVAKATWHYKPKESSDHIVLEYKQLCDEGSESASLRCAENYVEAYPAGSNTTSLITLAINWTQAEKVMKHRQAITLQYIRSRSFLSWPMLDSCLLPSPKLLTAVSTPTESTPCQ